MSKSKDNIFNFEYAENIFIGANGTIIKIRFNSGYDWKLGAYDTERDAKIALCIILNKIRSNHNFIEMPTEKDIQAYVVSLGIEKPRHITRKKTKGHGGS